MRPISALASGVVLVGLMVAFACEARPIATPKQRVEALNERHERFANVLARVVRADGVDYGALVADHADLDQYRAQLAATKLPDSANGRKALFINAYNAWTLALVVELLPRDKSRWPAWSIKEGGSLFRSVWKSYEFELAGRSYTLDQVEHEILRPMRDPRIHFAINCASRSCPALASAPYHENALDSELDAATDRFLTDSRQVGLTHGTLFVNPILDWFSADFEMFGGVRKFLFARVHPGPVKDFLASQRKLEFFEYDWRLNLAKPHQ